MSRRGPRFNEEQKLAILKEGEKNGVKAVCAKYDTSTQSYRLWRYKAQGTKRRKCFAFEKKIRILEERYLKGIQQVCNAYRINPTTYYYWKRRLGYLVCCAGSPPRNCHVHFPIPHRQVCVRDRQWFGKE
jgi:transposase-like protein